MPEPDKDERTKYMRAHDARRQKRADRLFHWSLDMPPAEDEVDVHVNKSAVTWRELAVIAAAILGGLLIWSSRNNTQPPPPAASQPAEPIRGTLRFWVDDSVQVEAETEAQAGAAAEIRTWQPPQNGDPRQWQIP